MSSLLPQPDHKDTLNYADGNNADIIETIHKNFPKAVEQTRFFARKFKGASARETAYNIWKFVKSHCTYKKDAPEYQKVKLPSRFLHEEGFSDCKSFALCTAALLANNKLPVKFRYANYTGGSIPSHVYTVTQDEDGREIIVDGVWKYFDSEKKPTYKFDRLMKVYTLSGTVTDTLRARLQANLQANPPGRPLDTSEAAFQAFLPRYYKKHPRAAAWHAKLKANNPDKYAERMDILRKRWIGWRLRRMKRYEGTMSEMISGIEQDFTDIGAFGFFKKIWKGVKKVGSGIVKVAKKVGKGVFTIAKKIALAPGRRAFRTMVALNFKGLAQKLKRVNDKDAPALAKKWKSLGGDPKALLTSIKKGYNHWATKHGKGPMTGIYGCDVPEYYKEAAAMGLITEDSPVGDFIAIAALAAPVLVAILSLLKKHGEDPNVPESEESGIDKIIHDATEAVETYNATRAPGSPALQMEDPTNSDNAYNFDRQAGEPDTPMIEEESESKFKLGTGPLLIGGGLALMFLTSKKRK